jgi:hypothetical protein
MMDDDSMRFDALIGGDRFAYRGEIWTKLDWQTARKHSKASLQLGTRGHGYHGDSVCSFVGNEAVIFLPPISVSALKMQG